MKAPRYWMETYGCQMNKAESAALELELLDAGWLEAAEPGQAELVVINTCSVRETAEERVRGRLGFFKRLKQRSPALVVLMGCMAERLRQAAAEELPAVDVVVGNFQKESFKELVRRAGLKTGLALGSDQPYRFSGLHQLPGEFKSLVPIMHGCDNFCAYCIVPYVRGREVSRPPAEVLAELETLLGRGVRELTLLGQNVNSYRWESEGRELDFPGLLAAAADLAGERAWLRFLTSHPKDFSPALIEAMAARPGICRHVHLPVQHGADRLLAAMNRRYDRAHFLKLVGQIRRGLPEVSLTTDVMVGFPGESERDFGELLELLVEVGFDDAFTYYYNPRQGTAAARLEDSVPRELKLARLEKVIELQRGLGAARRRARLGRTVKVLAEGKSKKDPGELLGRTERDEMVVFTAEAGKIGEFVEVELESLNGSTFKGRQAANA